MHTCVFVGTQNIKQRCRLLKCQNLTQITHYEYVYKQRLQRPQLRLRNSACQTINTFCLFDCQTNDSKAWQQIDCVPSHFSNFFSSDVLFASADFRFNLPHSYASHNTLYNLEIEVFTSFEWILQIYAFEIDKKNCFWDRRWCHSQFNYNTDTWMFTYFWSIWESQVKISRQ